MFKKLISLITQKRYFLLIGLGFISSALTFLFFFFSNSLLFKFEPKKEKIDIYEVAKEEAIKLGRIESDKEVPKIDPDGKVIVPSLTYYDIGGMGPNSNKSFVSNITFPIASIRITSLLLFFLSKCTINLSALSFFSPCIASALPIAKAILFSSSHCMESETTSTGNDSFASVE